MYDIFEPSLMNVKMKAQETGTLSQPKKLASRIQTSPQSQSNSYYQSQPMSQSNPFHKRETIKSSALPDYGLHSDRSRGEFAVSAAISPADSASFNRNNFKEPQAQEQVQPVPLQHSQVRPEKYPFPLVSAIPTASTSTSGVSQYLASPCSTLPRSSTFYPNHPASCPSAYAINSSRQESNLSTTSSSTISGS